jgi:hypothetical protein
MKKLALLIPLFLTLFILPKNAEAISSGFNKGTAGLIVYKDDCPYCMRSIGLYLCVVGQQLMGNPYTTNAKSRSMSLTTVIATTAIFFLGIGAFLGKVSWGTVVATTLGIVIMISALGIAATLTGNRVNGGLWCGNTGVTSFGKPIN